MKIHPIIIGAVILALAPMEVKARISVEEIHPPHWWVGMKDTTLQLQVKGKDIRNADFSVDYPGVRVDSVVRLDGSPDWQYIYLSISPETGSGELSLEWRKGKEKITRKYSLRTREENKGAKGFTAADVLYMIMPDRFADGDVSNNEHPSIKNKSVVDRKNLNVRHGGDLKGIRDHIHYLDSLGITAVWLNPVLENDMPGGAYHGYATTDYYRIDPRFGTNEEYKELISTLHSHGIKTVMDMIFNHCGIAHPWVEDPPSSDWFNLQDDWRQTNYRLSTITDPYASDRDRSMSVDGWFVYGMPDLNQNNPHLMKYLSQNSIWWIEESGIDGIRMDTYPYADRYRMGEWVDAVIEEFPEFNIVGECWFGDTGAEAFWQKGAPQAAAAGFDSRLPVVMDFPLMIKSRELKPFAEPTDAWNGLNKLYDHLALDFLYKDPMSVLRFLDNHDTERMIQVEPENLDSWKQAMLFLLTIPGIPQIYYGTELLMAGDRKQGDGNVRRDVPGGFPGDEVNVFTREGRSALQNEAFDFLSRINRWRKTSKAVAEGSMKHFMPDNGLYLYSRKSPGEEVIVILNGLDSENDVDMSRYAELIDEGEEFRDILTGKIIKLRDGSDRFTFDSRAVMLLERL